jgi:hypothetical protein
MVGVELGEMVTMTRLDPDITMETRPHRALCPCGHAIHRHAPITPEHAAWCRWLATRAIGPHRTLLTDGHERCVKEFPGMMLVRGTK